MIGEVWAAVVGTPRAVARGHFEIILYWGLKWGFPERGRGDGRPKFTEPGTFLVASLLVDVRRRAGQRQVLINPLLLIEGQGLSPCGSIGGMNHQFRLSSIIERARADDTGEPSGVCLERDFQT